MTNDEGIPNLETQRRRMEWRADRAFRDIAADFIGCATFDMLSSFVI